MTNLSGKKIAVLATDGFEQSELFDPKASLEKQGATVEIISLPDKSEIKAWNKKDWGKAVNVDKAVGDADASQYDALVLPGGVMNPDHLRDDAEAVAFVQAFAKSNKPVAAICHGPWLLAEAGVIDGKRVTSYSSIKTDLKNAGGRWEDKEVVVDGNLITSRQPDDIPAFTRAIVSALS